MAERRKDTPHAPFDMDEQYGQVARRMRELHVSRFRELPRIDLYLDQLLSLVSDELDFLVTPDEKLITGPMVNSYVKQRIVEAPIKKRYTRSNVAMLILLCAAKRVLSMAQIKLIRQLCDEANVDEEQAYDELVECLERLLATMFPEERSEDPVPVQVSPTILNMDGQPVPASLSHLVGSIVVLIANKVYTEQMLVLEGKRLQSLGI